jgi:hypothetical protein
MPDPPTTILGVDLRVSHDTVSVWIDDKHLGTLTVEPDVNGLGQVAFKDNDSVIDDPQTYDALLQRRLMVTALRDKRRDHAVRRLTGRPCSFCDGTGMTP